MLAAQIIAVADEGLRKRLADYRLRLAGEVDERSRRVAEKLERL